MLILFAVDLIPFVVISRELSLCRLLRDMSATQQTNTMMMMMMMMKHRFV